MILISTKAQKAMEKYFIEGLGTDEICEKLSRDGFSSMEVEAIRDVLNGEELSDIDQEED